MSSATRTPSMRVTINIIRALSEPCELKAFRSGVTPGHPDGVSCYTAATARLRCSYNCRRTISRYVLRIWKLGTQLNFRQLRSSTWACPS